MRSPSVTTYREIEVPAAASIVLKTDLDGVITHASGDLCRLSGYGEAELVGSPETILRHPDMPEAAYEDLWRDAAAGRTWSAALQCRCRNGEHFWMVADVIPVERQGVITGLMWSGRRALRYEIDRARIGYRRLRERLPGGPVMLHGRVVSNRFMGGVRQWFRNLRFAGRLSLLGAPIALLVLVYGLIHEQSIEHASGPLKDVLPEALTMLGAVMLFVAVSVFMTTRSVTRPLREVDRAIRSMAEGNFNTRVDGRRNDEVGRLLQNLKKLQVRMGYDVERMVFGGFERETVPPYSDAEAGATRRAAPRPSRGVSHGRVTNPNPVLRPRPAAAGGSRAPTAAEPLPPTRDEVGRSLPQGEAIETSAAADIVYTPAAACLPRPADGGVSDAFSEAFAAHTVRGARRVVAAPVPKVGHKGRGQSPLLDEWNDIGA